MWNDLVVDDEAPTAGCSWPIVGECAVELDDDDIKAWTQQMAIEILWAASGRQFGVCRSRYQPCETAPVCADSRRIDAWNLVGSHLPLPLAADPWGGSLFATMRCGGCAGDCACTRFASIELWHKRVRQVTEVMIDGVVLEPTVYRLHRNRLIRTDGGEWPTCQDFTVEPGQPGTWTVEYVHGRPVPFGGRVSAGILSCQLGLAITAPKDCALPKRVQTVTRQGVSMVFMDPMKFLTDGLTGLYEVDLWLGSVNPNRLARRARIMRADDPRRLARR